jgi:hypothetical protein
VRQTGEIQYASEAVILVEPGPAAGKPGEDVRLVEATIDVVGELAGTHPILEVTVHGEVECIRTARRGEVGEESSLTLLADSSVVHQVSCHRPPVDCAGEEIAQSIVAGVPLTPEKQ